MLQDWLVSVLLSRHKEGCMIITRPVEMSTDSMLELSGGTELVENEPGACVIITDTTYRGSSEDEAIKAENQNQSNSFN